MMSLSIYLGCGLNSFYFRFRWATTCSRSIPTDSLVITSGSTKMSHIGNSGHKLWQQPVPQNYRVNTACLLQPQIFVSRCNELTQLHWTGSKFIIHLLELRNAERTMRWCLPSSVKGCLFPSKGSRSISTVSIGRRGSHSSVKWAPMQGRAYWTPVCAACLCGR